MVDSETPATDENYRFRLYIAGNSAKSRRALKMLTNLTETRLGGRAQVEVIDIYQETERAKADQVVAVPTLIRELPEPLRRLLGDLSDRQQVLLALDIEPDSDDEDDAK